MILMGAIFLLVLASAAGYAALRVRRRRNRRDPMDRSDGFRPHIGFTSLDGMASLSLLLANGSKSYVWAEEIEIFLSGLSADEQTSTPTCHEIQKIRQMVPQDDLLPISLSEVVYKAAGDPQRKYSCVLSSILRYRIDNEQFEKKLENYSLQMLGLTTSRIRKERKPARPFPLPDKSLDVSVLAAKLK